MGAIFRNPIFPELLFWGGEAPWREKGTDKNHDYHNKTEIRGNIVKENGVWNIVKGKTIWEKTSNNLLVNNKMHLGLRN